MSTATYLDSPTFVLERRINQPLPRVNLGVSTGGPLVRSEGIPLRSGATLRVDAPLRRTLGSFDLAWRADARLLSKRGRVVARVQITVDGWSSDATRLQLRPIARRPERWSRRRLQRYFALGHLAADHVAGLLHDQACRPQLRPVPRLVPVS